MAAKVSPLRGRTAVVTGAARGLGEAVARRLADRGADVALLGREENALARVRDSLTGPGRALCWEVDVTDDAGMARVAAEVRERLGAPSVVVANAGVAEGGPFAESDPATWRRVIEVNLIGSAVTARSFLPALFDTRGFFLQVASLASIGAAPMMSAYCASKAGVESFAHSLRAELAHRQVGVGIAYINWTDTDMIRDADAHAVLRELRGHMPPPARRVYPAAQVAGPAGRGGRTAPSDRVHAVVATGDATRAGRHAPRGHDALPSRAAASRGSGTLRGHGPARRRRPRRRGARPRILQRGMKPASA
ncbi:short chain dehydrogenase [Streptomyces pristinaespiralis ATCC 25486]|uniref:Short chain dehydrogenase n=1 Tax=Streptomyces pristinaespiralis (strain ATCC 25486 / DSM 40338 / CBS 914.69 / JCM 4507 / KCC S-0507 / NBRC 13074 / NRRL 2958 / 5647) TaxID=457429 RepID=B5HCZ0_STRE2|nr:short chain dehydrogenase [Streptomyces pristinaespiralis ATCC 25486]